MNLLNMKYIYCLLCVLTITGSCTSPSDEDSNGKEDSTELTKNQAITDTSNETQIIVNKWILTKRTNTKKDKEVNYRKDNPLVIWQFDENGYFSIYDSIKDGEEKSKFSKIEVRSSEQWEINGNELTLKHTLGGAVKIEIYDVLELTALSFQIKNKKKDMINQFQVKK